MLEYATGLIDVLEKNIFDHQDQDRMINAPNREAAFRVLFDTDLAEASIKIREIEKILEKDLVSLREFIFKMVKEEREELFWFLFLKFDALNLKIALKEKFSDDFNPNFSFDSSIIPFSEIQKRISDSKNKIENSYIESMVEESLAGVENSSEIEEVVDMVFLEIRTKIAKKAGKLPSQISRLEIDIANLKNLIKNKDRFVKGGNLSRQDLIRLLGLEKGMISKGLEKFLETFNLSLIIKDFKDTGIEVDLEKRLEVFLSEEIFKKERDRGSGTDKIVSYFYRKINIHSNIRLIFFAKENNLSVKEIKSNILPI